MWCLRVGTLLFVWVIVVGAVFGGSLLGSVVCAVLVVVFADFGLIIVHACSWVCFVMLWVWRFGSVGCVLVWVLGGVGLGLFALVCLCISLVRVL